jgi:hypothetical protein
LPCLRPIAIADLARPCQTLPDPMKLWIYKPDFCLLQLHLWRTCFSLVALVPWCLGLIAVSYLLLLSYDCTIVLLILFVLFVLFVPLVCAFTSIHCPFVHLSIVTCPFGRPPLRHCAIAPYLHRSIAP